MAFMSVLYRWLRVFRRLAWMLALLLVVWAIYLFGFGNFHKVNGDLYRSAQLFRYNLPYYLEHHGIRSIINLRGAADADWYRDERRIARELGVRHVDFGISDRQVLSLEKMNELVQLMHQLPKPLLIHCKAGADRTSLAAALYLHSIQCDSRADRMISIVYGHFPWLGSRTVAMDQSFDQYLKAYPEGRFCTNAR